jgi:hypothetical protein
MSRKDESADAGDRDEATWDGGELLEADAAGAGPNEDEVEVEAVVTGVDDLDELDAPIDDVFGEGEAWDLESLELEEEEEEEEEEDDELDDEAEMQLLHELGIDLDAADAATGLDLELDLDQDDPADDGVAA